MNYVSPLPPPSLLLLSTPQTHRIGIDLAPALWIEQLDEEIPINFGSLLAAHGLPIRVVVMPQGNPPHDA